MIMSGILSSLVGKGAEEAARKQALIQMKKGKTNEQKDYIDFFTTTNKGGCIGKVQGCLGRGGSTMTMDAYVAKVQEKCRMLNLKSRAITQLGIDESDATSLIDPICLYNFKL